MLNYFPLLILYAYSTSFLFWTSFSITTIFSFVCFFFFFFLPHHVRRQTQTPTHVPNTTAIVKLPTNYRKYLLKLADPITCSETPTITPPPSHTPRLSQQTYFCSLITNPPFFLLSSNLYRSILVLLFLSIFLCFTVLSNILCFSCFHFLLFLPSLWHVKCAELAHATLATTTASVATVPTFSTTSPTWSNDAEPGTSVCLIVDIVWSFFASSLFWSLMTLTSTQKSTSFFVWPVVVNVVYLLLLIFHNVLIY